jgi:hypothetical protein
MAQSGEGKQRVFIVDAAGGLLSSGGMRPMRSEPSLFGVLLGIGAAPVASRSLGEVA